MENEFDAPENGVKQMREALDRQADKNKKLEAELALYKDKEIDSVFGKIGLETNKGFGKALKQVYDGPVDVESISQFAKDEYGFEPTGQVQDVTQPEPEPEAEQADIYFKAEFEENVTIDIIIKNGSKQKFLE